jgi:hypothetical protein
MIEQQLPHALAQMSGAAKGRNEALNGRERLHGRTIARSRGGDEWRGRGSNSGVKKMTPEILAPRPY